MISRFSKLMKLPKLITPARQFTTDWGKDRERAAEKEFMLKEEKRKMQNLRTKLKEDAHSKRFVSIADNELDIDEVLSDREWLIVG